MARDYEGMVESQDSSNARSWEASPWFLDPRAQGFNPNTSSGYSVGGSGQYTSAPYEMLELADPNFTWSIQDVYDKVYKSSPAYEEGKSFNEFLSSGISPWKLAGNDRVTFDPNKHTQWIAPKNIGALAMLGEFAQSPIMKLLSIPAAVAGAQALLAPGAGAAGAAGGLTGASAADLAALIESGTVGTAGAGIEAAAGIGTGAAGAGAGSFIENVDLGNFSNAMEVSSGAPTADFSLMPQGTGINGASAGLGLNTTGIGLTPELVAAGGGAGAMGVGGGLGLNLAAGAGAAGTLGTTAATGGIISQISKALGLPIDKVMEKATTDPLLKTLIDGYGIWSQGKTNDEIEDIIRQGMAQSDPFGSQRGFYQDQLKQSYTDPNFFNNNPTFSGIRNMAINDVGRQAAARGYNNSSNVLYGIGQRIADEGSKYALNWQNQTGQLAGGGVSPSGVAAMTTLGANQAQQGNEQQAGNWGSFLRETLPQGLAALDKYTTPSNIVSPP